MHLLKLSLFVLLSTSYYLHYAKSEECENIYFFLYDKHNETYRIYIIYVKPYNLKMHYIFDEIHIFFLR